MTTDGSPACGPCEGRLYCPIHYRPDPEAEARNRLHERGQHWKPFTAGMALPALSSAEKIATGPLFDARTPRLPARFLITGAWETVVFHLTAYALKLQEVLNLCRTSVEVLTDMQLIETRFDRSAEAPFSQRITRAGFLVIRLGFQGTKNTELPGVVWEALRVRESSNLPIVLTCEPFRPWSKSHPAWSDELDKFIIMKLAKVSIG